MIDLFVYVDTFTKSESSETYQTTEDPDKILPDGRSGWFVFLSFSIRFMLSDG